MTGIKIYIDMYFTKYPLNEYEKILNEYLYMKSKTDNNVYELNINREYLGNKIIVRRGDHSSTYTCKHRNNVKELTDIFDLGISEISIDHCVK